MATTKPSIKKTITTPTHRRKYLLAAVALCIIAALAGGIYLLQRDDDKTSNAVLTEDQVREASQKKTITREPASSLVEDAGLADASSTEAAVAAAEKAAAEQQAAAKKAAKKSPTSFTFVDSEITPVLYHKAAWGFQDEWLWFTQSFETTGYDTFKTHYTCTPIAPSTACAGVDVQVSNDNIHWISNAVAKIGMDEDHPTDERSFFPADIKHKYFRLVLTSTACPMGCSERPEQAAPYHMRATLDFYNRDGPLPYPAGPRQ
ncbi:MAG TPA: hypothetical protein VD735_01855 [Candidatus Saccharimonadales bacterium]|nr:hypothetical protein [Candidatus Saccharimonadales bacterium]